MKCNYCGSEFEYGNRPDGLPNGVGLVLNDGSIINVCCDCVVNLGMIAKGKENNEDQENVTER